MQHIKYNNRKLKRQLEKKRKKMKLNIHGIDKN